MRVQVGNGFSLLLKKSQDGSIHVGMRGLLQHTFHFRLWNGGKFFHMSKQPSEYRGQISHKSCQICNDLCTVCLSCT